MTTKTALKNTRIVQQTWGIEIHKRLLENEASSTFKQVGASVGPDALKFYLGRAIAIGERSTLKARGFIEV